MTRLENASTLALGASLALACGPEAPPSPRTPIRVSTGSAGASTSSTPASWVPWMSHAHPG